MRGETKNPATFAGRAWRLLSSVWLVILAATPSAAQPADGISMIVRTDNPVTQMARPDVVRIFLGQVTTWKDGTKIRPVDQSMTSSVRKEFANAVLKQPLSVVENYWRQQIFAGRAAPPAVKNTDADVAEFVSATPGAIGYVATGSTLPKGVRVFTVSE